VLVAGSSTLARDGAGGGDGPLGLGFLLAPRRMEAHHAVQPWLYDAAGDLAGRVAARETALASPWQDARARRAGGRATGNAAHYFHWAPPHVAAVQATKAFHPPNGSDGDSLMSTHAPERCPADNAALCSRVCKTPRPFHCLGPEISRAGPIEAAMSSTGVSFPCMEDLRTICMAERRPDCRDAHLATRAGLVRPSLLYEGESWRLG